jgi:ABC-type Zn uptake system ZnuABC Zn-binding protein ZnuA
MVLATWLAAGCGTAPQSEQLSDAASAPAANAPVAVSNPYLESAIRDILSNDAPLVPLCGPAMCPGHFDMRPSQISDLAKCRLLIRFDFQQALDDKLPQRSTGPLPTLAVEASGGLCVPETYVAVCRQIAAHFVSAGELSPAEAEQRLNQVAQRMKSLTQASAQKIDAAGLRNTPVLTSQHQEAFCRWLGLRVESTFSGSDTASTRDIDQTVTAGQAAKIRWIIANEPEGRRLADALADRLKAKVVVFANFPKSGEALAFDALVRQNLAALMATTPLASTASSAEQP